jgi:chromate transporter
MPWARLMIVEERGWLDEAGFVNLVSLSQLLPGPNIVNLSVMLGRRFAGLSGALAALGGLMIAPLTIVLCLGALYARFGQLPQLNRMFGNVAAAAAGLILATAAKMARPHINQPLSVLIAGATFAAAALLRWPVLAIVLAMAPISILLHARWSK